MTNVLDLTSTGNVWTRGAMTGGTVTGNFANTTFTILGSGLIIPPATHRVLTTKRGEWRRELRPGAPWKFRRFPK